LSIVKVWLFGNGRYYDTWEISVTGLDYDDIEHSESELRSVRIGLSPIGRIVFVVYTRRVKYDKETVRVISARQATRKERAAYAG